MSNRLPVPRPPPHQRPTPHPAPVKLRDPVHGRCFSSLPQRAPLPAHPVQARRDFQREGRPRHPPHLRPFPHQFPRSLALHVRPSLTRMTSAASAGLSLISPRKINVRVNAPTLLRRRCASLPRIRRSACGMFTLRLHVLFPIGFVGIVRIAPPHAFSIRSASERLLTHTPLVPS